MTVAERQAKRRRERGKSINRRRRTLYKIAVESDAKKAKRARREENLAGIARRTKAATEALSSPGMPLCNLITLDPPWPHENFSVETGSDRSSDNHYAPMTWPEIEALGGQAARRSGLHADAVDAEASRGHGRESAHAMGLGSAAGHRDDLAQDAGREPREALDRNRQAAARPARDNPRRGARQHPAGPARVAVGHDGPGRASQRKAANS